MKPSDLIPGRQYIGPSGQIRELLRISETHKRIQYRQITTMVGNGGGHIAPGRTRWIEAASFASWAIREAA